jgi:hypothetical protein
MHPLTSWPIPADFGSQPIFGDVPMIILRIPPYFSGDGVAEVGLTDVLGVETGLGAVVCGAVACGAVVVAGADVVVDVVPCEHEVTIIEKMISKPRASNNSLYFTCFNLHY